MTALAPFEDPLVRRSGIGGTDVAKILGLSRFGGRHDVYAEKVGQTAPLIETEPMTWGKRLEDTVARYWSEQTGMKVQRVNKTLRHQTMFFKMAHLDRIVVPKSNGILEVKTAGAFAAAEFGEQMTDQVPPDYFMQALHYCHVADAPRVHFAVLVAGQSFRRYVYERDRELEAVVEGEVESFWQHNVVPRVPPDIDGSEGASRYLASRFPRVVIPQVPLTDEMIELAESYASAHQQKLAAEAAKETFGNQLRSYLGEAAEATDGRVTVRWSQVAGARRLDLDALRATHPEVVAEFTRQEEPGRRLTVTVKEPT